MQYLDPLFLIQTVGLAGVFFIIFAESGLFFGFFFPGDSLLFTAGFLSSQTLFSFPILCFGTFAAAVLGTSFGYFFGKQVGPKIFSREDSFFFHKKHITEASKFYERHGKGAIIIARFIPVVRTFAPIVAGVGGMKYKTFFVYNCLGALIWAGGLTSIGYFLGKTIPDADKYILQIVLVIIATSFLPGIIAFFRRKPKQDSANNQ